MPAAYTLDEFNKIVESQNYKENFGDCTPTSVNTDIYKLPDDNKYVLPVIETQLGLYSVDRVERLPDTVIKENLLIYPYRVHGTLAKPSAVYNSYPQMLKQLAKTCNLAIDNIPDWNALIREYENELEKEQ